MMTEAGNELPDKCPNSIDRKTAVGIICIEISLVFVSLSISKIESPP